MKNTSVNTALLLVYLLLLYLGSTLLIPGLLESYAFKAVYVVFGFLLAFFYYSQIPSKTRVGITRFIILGGTLLLLNLLFSQSKYFHVLNIFSVVALYAVLPYTSIDGNKLTRTLLLFFFVMAALNVGKIIGAALATEEEGYASFFQSANGMGPCVYAMLLCLVYRFYNHGVNASKFKYLVLFGVTLFILYTTHCRSILLALLLWILGIYVLRKRFVNENLFFIIYIIGIFAIGALMVYAEVIQGEDSLFSFEMYGKGTSSRGRAGMIYMAFEKYSVNLFGYGNGVATGYVADMTGYTIHNMYVATLLDYGLLFTLFYLYFVYKCFKRCDSVILKSFLLSIQLFFFFEPFTAFDSKIMMVILYVCILQNSMNNSYSKKLQSISATA